MYLFFGLRKKEDLPFSYEIQQLQNAGLLTPFYAYSNEPGVKKKYVQSKLEDEADLVLQLLHNVTTRVYVCGKYGMEVGVRESLILLLAKGNLSYPGLGIARATERLALLKTTNKYIAEVYGAPHNSGNDKILEATWKIALEKASRAHASLRQVRIPLPPHDERESHVNERGNNEDRDENPAIILDTMEAVHTDWRKSLKASIDTSSSFRFSRLIEPRGSFRTTGSVLRREGNLRGSFDIEEYI